MREPNMEECMTFTKSNYNWVILEEGEIKLKGIFLIELGMNAFSRADGENAIEHIENFLEVINLIKVPKVSDNQIWLRVFPHSLTGAASKWWEDESIGSTTDMYGYIKNHKKTVKNVASTDTKNERVKQKPVKQIRIKSNLQSTPVNLGQQKSTTKDKTQNVSKNSFKFQEALQHNGRVNYVKSRALIDHLSIKATWLWKKAQGKVDFTLGSLRDVAQAVTSRMTAWQSLSVHT
ncbi:hypothetical protein Tco_1204425 [Tanacetum coccineum]